MESRKSPSPQRQSITKARQPLNSYIALLKQENEQLRADLKKLNNALDDILAKRGQKRPQHNQETLRQKELQTANTRAGIMEREIAQLEALLTKSDAERRGMLEDEIEAVQTEIRERRRAILDLKRQVGDKEKRLESVQKTDEELEMFKKLQNELRIVKEHCRDVEERYQVQAGQYQHTLEVCQGMEGKARELGIDPDNLYPKPQKTVEVPDDSGGMFGDDDEPVMAPVDESDILGMQNAITDQEERKRRIFARYKKQMQDIDDRLASQHKLKSTIESKLKNCEIRCRTKDMKIKALKRQIRQSSSKQQTPNMSFEQVPFKVGVSNGIPKYTPDKIRHPFTKSTLRPGISKTPIKHIKKTPIPHQYYDDLEHVQIHNLQLKEGEIVSDFEDYPEAIESNLL